MNKSGAPLITRSYHIPLSMFDDAFLKFQRKFVYPANIFLSVILLAIAGVYVHAVMKDNTQTLAYLLIVICIALILVRWYKTFKLRRSVHNALADVEQDTYEMKIWKEGIVIRTEDAPKPEQTVQLEKKAAPEPEQGSDAEGDGFRQIFPDEPAETAEPVAPTEIPFGDGVKILEYPEYFMVYIVKQNFYVIPKKDFSDPEIAQMKELFGLQK